MVRDGHGLKNLRLSEEELRGILNRGRKVTTHKLKDEEPPKLIIQILLNEIGNAGLEEPALEYRFHGERKWRFDLAWVKDKIALEVEGGVWIRGRHSRGAGMEADMEKYNEAQLLGWTVLRYSTGQIKQGKPLNDLKRALSK